MARRVTAKQRVEVTRRAHNFCEYCRSPGRVATQAMSIEHIHPKQQGGGSELDNLALSCQGFNSFKSTKTTGLDPFTGRRVPLFHPRQQSWNAHFMWGDNETRVAGLTPTGRATVLVLRLNREGVVNLRDALRANGQHPPPETAQEAQE